MSGFTGFVQAALQIGVDSIIVKPKRGIYGAVAFDGTAFNDIVAQAVLEEHHTDQVEVTEHPIEQGAAIADHAFKRPAEVIVRMAWSNSPSSPGGILGNLAGRYSGLAGAALGSVAANSTVARGLANVAGVAAGLNGIQSAINGAGIDQIQSIYQNLLQLQEKRALFTLFTGKRKYDNMICATLVTETDSKSANNLLITMTCKQLILVNTQTVTIPKGATKNDSQYASPVDKGTKNPVSK